MKECNAASPGMAVLVYGTEAFVMTLIIVFVVLCRVWGGSQFLSRPGECGRGIVANNGCRLFFVLLSDVCYLRYDRATRKIPFQVVCIDPKIQEWARSRPTTIEGPRQK